MSNAQITIGALYEAYRAPLLAFLARIVGNPDVAEDLCQDTFVKVLRGWSGRNPHGSVQAWVYEIARNTAYDYLRSQRRQPSAALDAELADAAAPAWEESVVEAASVRQALAQVPAPSRAALVLQACTGAPVRDIARRLGCPPNTVQMRLQRGRTRFRTAFAALS